MKTKFILTIALLAISLASIAQEKHYIETTVSDTVRLKPLQIRYKISISEPSYTYEITDTQGIKDTSKSTSITDVEGVLKKEKFNWSENDDNNYTISKATQNKSSLIVTLKTKSELDRLCKAIYNLKGISGKISSTDYESASLYTDAMFKRLYDKAKLEANIMAKTTGNTVGSMVSASESQDQYGGYMDWLMELSENSSNNIWGINGGLYKVYTRKFTFRFELK